MGEAVDKFINDNKLDSRAVEAIRVMPPQQQAVVIRWDLRGYDNPSAKLMSLINDMPAQPRSFFPFMGPMGMPPMGIAPLPMGMLPMMGYSMPPGMPPPPSGPMAVP